MSEAVVQIEHLSKKIKGKTIIDDLNLSLFKGEVFGFLGPNGAGKTTTIRMMVGLMKPTQGKVFIDGHDLTSDYTKAIEQVGAIVENPELYSYMTGYQNLVHFARLSKGVSKDRIAEVIEQVGLKKYINQKVKTYSLGMRQRLGLAQALLHKPKFLILDEPTNGLDPAGIREFRNYLRQIAKEEGVSILVSSHLLSEMELMCDRIGIIQKGKLIDIREVHSKDMEQQTIWRFTVGDFKKAKDILTKANVEEIKSVDSSLLLQLEKEQVPVMNKLLVEHDISVYEITEAKKTLEEQFLEITGGASVE